MLQIAEKVQVVCYSLVCEYVLVTDLFRRVFLFLQASTFCYDEFVASFMDHTGTH